MDTTNPGPLAMLGGGALMVIATFFKWGPNFGVSLSDAGADPYAIGIGFGFLGLFGILTLLFGLAIAAYGASKAFSFTLPVPDALVGFSIVQLCLALAFSVFLWTFAMIGESGIKIGTHLAWIGAAVAVVGAFLEMRTGGATTDSTPRSI